MTADADADAARHGGGSIDDLLPLALSSPREALARARAVLAAGPGLYEASVAHQAAGIVLRDFGEVAAATRHLRQAVRMCQRAGAAEREADVLASLGVALVYAGRTAAGLAAFDQALDRSGGALKGRVLHRRAIVWWALGRYAEAIEDLRQAVTVFLRMGDSIWVARALNARGTTYLALGWAGRAGADFRAAERYFAQTSQEFESIHPVHNRGVAALLSGDLPEALSCLDEAASRYRPLRVSPVELTLDRCTALLAAGLARDALAEAVSAIEECDQMWGQAARKAELLLMAADCALACRQPRDALGWARSAYRLFRSKDSPWWQAHARMVLARARFAAGTVTSASLAEADAAARQLGALRAPDATQAHLLAGRIALCLGRREDADWHFAAAARRRWRGSPVARAAAWLGVALAAEADGRSRRLLGACRRGLDVLDQHRLALGGSELRAQATAHGGELAALALRHAAHAGRPRQLLSWSERWRATALDVPAVRPCDDPELRTGLTALRQVTSQLDQARRDGTPTPGLEREQRRLENQVRACALRARGTTGPSRARLDTGALLDALGDTRLVQIVEVDGDLYALVCGRGRVRQFAAGTAPAAARAADFTRFALRRLSRCRPTDDMSSALAILGQQGPNLQQALLGPAARHLGDGPLVIVPPGRLHTVPWALLPALAGRPFSVAPSASAWLRAHTTPPPARHRVTLARGPGLASNGAEVPELAGLYDDVTVLADSDATTSAVLGALDGAWLAHIAAHGSFRADSPLFSSLRMQDGPLTVYDFEQLERAPYRMVLSACDSGVLAAAGADELLGLVASLLPLGTAGIIAGVAPLNDHEVVPVMLRLHHSLQAGQTLAESMCTVRHDLAGDPIQQVTAASLVALGAA